MKLFVSGGSSSGKSRLAEEWSGQLGKNKQPLYYVATMIAVDTEDQQRIQRHRRQRKGLPFITLEQPRQIQGILEKSQHHGTFLLDSLSALMANEMFLPHGEICNDAPQIICAQLEAVFCSVGHIVVVSDNIYNDGMDYDSFTEQYRKGLAQVDRYCAQQCDIVVEVCAGCVIVHKGQGEMEAFTHGIF